MASNSYDTFEAVQNRLDEIVDAVGDESLPLDEALALYEEAVNLGLRGSDLLEENIEAFDAQQAAAASDVDESVADTAAAEGADADDDAAASTMPEAAEAVEGPADAAASQTQDDSEPHTLADEIR